MQAGRDRAEPQCYRPLDEPNAWFLIQRWQLPQELASRITRLRSGHRHL